MESVSSDNDHQSNQINQSDQTSITSSNSSSYRVKNPPTETPLAYHAVISLFRFVLAIFFSRIVIENIDQIPTNGQPTIVLANHSNSLTDALIIMSSIPRHARRMLRMTAKATHFRRGTFSSWLIEKAGSVPLQRSKDYTNPQTIDNSLARKMLIDALCENGDAICLFPEGISRYHPSIAPLKTGTARIASDVLYKEKDNEGFELNLLTCSITYLHRQNFRSDVLVSFHSPIKLKPKENLKLISEDIEVRKLAISELTDKLSERIRSGTLDSPSWDLIKAANLARTIYAPFGTKIGLGSHVRLTQKFIDAFAGRNGSESDSNPTDSLVKNLLDYQNRLTQLGIKDERVANNRLIKTRVIFKRLVVRLIGAGVLTSICFPGILLWFPAFFTAWFFAERQKRTGPAWDTYDEVTQTKLLYGLASGLITYFTVVLFTFPIFPITAVGVPLLMWFTLRWLEDLVATLRAARSLSRMLMLGQNELNSLRNQRRKLIEPVRKIAIEKCRLPIESEKVLLDEQNELVIKNGKVSRLGYFSIRRRRKKDYNEVLRLWDVVDM
ncbi:hypothetical protein DFH28DRAFT_1050580 [Melampsora americana]|nr:hypothetical protein DFH28DRAFT_1050580 [Melampsora americana]